MRFSNSWLLVVMLVTLLVAGCSTFLSSRAPADSYPVQSGVASTNDAAVVAWLKVAQAANTSLNPTSTQTPISLLIGGLIGITSVASGWYVHRSGLKRGVALQPTPAKPGESAS